MDYGGVDKRKSKNDKKKKRQNRVYKKGGKFRSKDIDEVSLNEEGGKKKCKNNKEKK